MSNTNRGKEKDKRKKLERCTDKRTITHELKTKDRVKKNQKVIGMNESITKKVSRRGDYTYFVYCRSSAGLRAGKERKRKKEKRINLNKT